MSQLPEPLPGTVSGPSGFIVHLVGRLTDSVFGFLGPASDTLAASGAMQVLICIDDAESRAMIPRLHRSVEVLLANDHANPMRRWLELHWLLRSVLRRRSVVAVHLHGFYPSIVGALATRRLSDAPRTTLYFSPHSSRTLIGSWRFLARPLLWLVRPVSDLTRQVPIPNVLTDARRLSALTGTATTAIESPVGDAFFDVERHEARHPLVFSSALSSSARTAELFSQLAILLAGSGLGLSFNWIGPVEPVAHRHLTAANVGVFGSGDDAERAHRLAGGWIYVAVGETRGFPAHLAEAMAAGIACVVLTDPAHHDLIDDGVTGFICNDQQEMLLRVAELIDSPELRQRLGLAARSVAFERFSTAAFRRNLIAAYERGEVAPDLELNTAVES